MGANPITDPEENEVDEFAVDPELQAIMDKLNAKVNVNSGGELKKSNIVFLPEGSHIIKMVIPKERELEEYVEPYTGQYEGKPSLSFLVNGVIVKSLDPSGKDTELADRTSVRHIRLPKTAVLQINALIPNKIFNDDGPVITIKRYKDGAGKAAKTVYLVTPMPNKMKPSEIKALTWPEMTIDRAARDAEEFALKMSEGGTDTLPFATNGKKADGSEWL